jgi:hypothetical protein
MGYSYSIIQSQLLILNSMFGDNGMQAKFSEAKQQKGTV